MVLRLRVLFYLALLQAVVFFRQWPFSFLCNICIDKANTLFYHAARSSICNSLRKDNYPGVYAPVSLDLYFLKKVHKLLYE